jgi:hypothetical protein
MSKSQPAGLIPVPEMLGRKDIRPSDRLFETFRIFLTLMSSIFDSVDRVQNRPPGGPVHLQSTKFDLRIIVRAGGLFDLALRLQTPQVLEFEFARADPRALYPDTPVNQFSTAIRYLDNMTFGSFFEQHVSWIRTTYGRDTSQWPPLLNFSRVIRNAAFHRGILSFDSEVAPPVSWRGITLGRSQNGQRILGPTKIELPDMILLLFDLSAELDRLGAPPPA